MDDARIGNEEKMKIRVNLADRSYDVCLDEPGEDLPGILLDKFPDKKFALITNDKVGAIYADKLAAWEDDLHPLRHTLKDGEQYKTVETWSRILDDLLEARLDRGTVIIAFGGGVVGDIAGFAAASFLRGVDYIQVPTTLLAMVDSSVGGKTAVNHEMGKNLIGAFYQPKLVWIETDVLSTLPERDYVSGYAEVFKYGFIGKRSMFDFIANKHHSILEKNPVALREAIKRSIEIKAAIVSRDERESGIRALLNFGHTFGHALEKFFSYKGIHHGEAIYWGCVCAVDLGRRCGTVSESDVNAFESQIDMLNLPPLPARPDIPALYNAMFSDKKVAVGKLRFVLPSTPGVSVVTSDVRKADVLATLKTVFGEF